MMALIAFHSASGRRRCGVPAPRSRASPRDGGAGSSAQSATSATARRQRHRAQRRRRRVASHRRRADRALRIARNAHLAPAHRQRVEQEQPAGERLADAGDELQRLGGLRRADDADDRREHAHDRAARRLELLAFAEEAVIARRVADRARSNTATCPSKRIAAPETSGISAATQARFTACRVAKLSLQSSTTSARATSGASSAGPIRASMASMRTSGLIAARRAFAAATFGVPTSGVA